MSYFKTVWSSSIFFRSFDSYDTIPLTSSTTLLTNKNFNCKWKTAIYTFGWTGKFNYTDVQLIVNAYTKIPNYNIIVNDWGDYSDGEYVEVAFKTKQVRSRIALLSFC